MLRFIQQLTKLAIISLCDSHQFITLTKRPLRMNVIFNHPGILDFIQDAVVQLGFGTDGQDQVGENGWPLVNLHPGVSVECQNRALERVPWLLDTCATTRLISVEPLLAPVDISPFAGRPVDDITGDYMPIDWVIAGPETGPGKRHCEPLWMDDLAGQSQEYGVPFFDKRDHSPESGIYRTRQFPIWLQ